MTTITDLMAIYTKQTKTNTKNNIAELLKTYKKYIQFGVRKQNGKKTICATVSVMEDGEVAKHQNDGKNATKTAIDLFNDYVATDVTNGAFGDIYYSVTEDLQTLAQTLRKQNAKTDGKTEQTEQDGKK